MREIAERVLALEKSGHTSLAQLEHAVALARYALEAEKTLIRCAELSGEDGEAVEAARSGAMKHPSVTEWAVACVEQLRRDYDECCLAEHEPVAQPTERTK